MDYESWYNGTYGLYNDPRECDGSYIKCCNFNCDNEVEYEDDKCDYCIEEEEEIEINN